MAYSKLTKEEAYVIEEKGTEPPFSGIYWNHFAQGVYRCRRCRQPLYLSHDKFASSCGWPSFDDELPGRVKRQIDADGRRTEIICSGCNGHLGHVFSGEGLTEKNTRHCVNSLSMEFTPAQRALFASGCFWGTQYHCDRAPGVLATRAGYTGGSVKSPTYQQVCSGRTGHVEAVEVWYDPEATSYDQLARLFFETHDPTQKDGQGPDIGSQYLSVLFYSNEEERKTAEGLIRKLKDDKLKVATKLREAGIFYPAELYHQHYYDLRGSVPYCHTYVKRF